MGLQGMKLGYFDARIYQETIVKIWAHHATGAALPLRTRAQEIWCPSTVPPPTRYDKEIKQVQKIVGSILYYARMVDMTVLMALSSIASELTKCTKRTLEKAYQVLNYLALHPYKVVRFQASDRCWTSIQMHYIWVSQKLVVEHAAIFSWALYQETECLSSGISHRGRTWGIICELPKRDGF